MNIRAAQPRSQLARMTARLGLGLSALLLMGAAYESSTDQPENPAQSESPAQPEIPVQQEETAPSSARASRSPGKGTRENAKETESSRMEKKLDEILANQTAILQRFDAVMEELRIIKVRATLRSGSS